MLLTAVLIPAEESGFVASNPETGTTTQGETVREATELYLEEFPVESACELRQSAGHPGQSVGYPSQIAG